jgi:long-chain acyl-CoA synthetase
LAQISDSHLADRVKALGTGLRLVGLTHEDNVLLLLNDSVGKYQCISICLPLFIVLLGPFAEFLITELALASHSIPSLTLASSSLLYPVLESHPPTAIVVEGKFLPNLLELMYKLCELAHHFIIVVGEADEKVLSKVPKQTRLVHWTHVEAQGKAGATISSPAPCKSLSTHLFRPDLVSLTRSRSGPDDVFTVSYCRDASDQVRAVHLTHQNITAGVTAIRALLPASAPLSALDTIISAHSLSTAFGRTVAYTALYEGTSFATLESSKLFKAIGMALIVFHFLCLSNALQWILHLP